MSKIIRIQPVHSLLVLFLLFTIVLAACGGGAEPTQAPSGEAEATEPPAENEPDAGAPAGSPGFSADIQPIFDASCSGCHGSRASGGVQLNSYENLMGSNVVTAGDSAGSVLWQVVDSGEMPKAGQPLSAEKVQLIADWINAGANND